MTEILKGFGRVINLWPETDYEAYMPSESPSIAAWKQVGEHIAKAIVIEVIRSDANEDVLARLNLALKEIENQDAHKLDNKLIHHATIINEQKDCARREEQQ